MDMVPAHLSTDRPRYFGIFCVATARAIMFDRERARNEGQSYADGELRIVNRLPVNRKKP